MQPEITHTTELDYQDYIYTVTAGGELFLKYTEVDTKDCIHFGSKDEMIAVAKAMLEAAGISIT
jgi:hypothetical protein